MVKADATLMLKKIVEEPLTGSIFFLFLKKNQTSREKSSSGWILCQVFLNLFWQITEVAGKLNVNQVNQSSIGCFQDEFCRGWDGSEFNGLEVFADTTFLFAKHNVWQNWNEIFKFSKWNYQL